MNIDNDITLYSMAELETMKRIKNNKHSSSYVPFSLLEIETEINKRNNR